jgi:putative endonuclease
LRLPSREPREPAGLAGHLQRGQRAEQVAGRFLAARGLRPLAANFRCRWGELDLVMTDGPCLVVVEVRCRVRPGPATPVETVSPAKCRRIIQATRAFLGRHPALAERPVRFDVVGILGDPGEDGGDEAHPRVDWIRGAFTLDDVAGY